jgi:hypothetical protein
MSWVFATLASTAIWIVSFFVEGGGPSNFYAFLLVFLVVPLFLAPLLAVLAIASMLARAIGKTFIVRLVLFYVFAVMLSAAVSPLLLAVTPISKNRSENLDFAVKTVLVPSLLASLAYPFFVLRNPKGRQNTRGEG